MMQSSGSGSGMEISVWNGFELEKAVCNHGFFMMAPNTWNPTTKTLLRPLRINQSTVTVSISQSSPTSISIFMSPSPPHFQPILDQVKRMLRLSKKDEEQVKRFQRLHVGAARKGFGRLFRNPCLFEDIVKSLLLCGCRFADSLSMAERVCNLNLKRKRGRFGKESKFPTAEEVAGLDRYKLGQMSLGYRGELILELAKGVVSGKIDLDHMERHYTITHANGDELYQHLITNIKGVGDFVSSNLLMCCGFYHKLPLDSETLRHLKQVHGCQINKNTDANAMIKDIYGKYSPFQTLAYWFELLEYYENQVGKLSLLQKDAYKNVTGSFLSRTA